MVQAEGVGIITDVASRSKYVDVLRGVESCCGPLQALFIDADSKDSSLGMSAPPLAFVSRETLSAMHESLSSGGLLAVNVVARQDALLNALVEDIKAVFLNGHVWTARAGDETVNVVVAAVKRVDTSDKSKSKTEIGRQQSQQPVQPWRTIEKWLASVQGLSTDPLDLGDLIDKFRSR